MLELCVISSAGMASWRGMNSKTSGMAMRTYGPARDKIHPNSSGSHLLMRRIARRLLRRAAKQKKRHRLSTCSRGYQDGVSIQHCITLQPIIRKYRRASKTTISNRTASRMNLVWVSKTRNTILPSRLLLPRPDIRPIIATALFSLANF